MNGTSGLWCHLLSVSATSKHITVLLPLTSFDSEVHITLIFRLNLKVDEHGVCLGMLEPDPQLKGEHLFSPMLYRHLLHLHPSTSSIPQ